MLNRIQKFLKTTLLGGLIVILPTIILIFAFKWLFGVVSQSTLPLSRLVINRLPLPDRFDDPIATLIAVIIIFIGCFLVGLFISTRLGRWIFEAFESALLIRTPGYKLVKETVHQFIGRKKSPFSAVVLARIFENDTQVTAFLTDEHADGRVTIFVPTGPNPTSGFIYHLDQKYIERLDVATEDAMRTVISCGSGSADLFDPKK